MADLFAEKLAKVREQRAASRLLQQAKARQSEVDRAAAAAEADRKAAAEERARWERLKSGSFLEGIKALGKDPRQAFEEMQREAVEAGTPEAQLRAMRDEFARQLAEQVEPLKKTIAELTESEKRARAEALEHAFASDFRSNVTDPTYEALLDEYPEERLLAYATAFRDDPAAFRKQAEEVSHRLTDPSGSFTMKDILDVLKAVQTRHYAEVEKRRAARAAATPNKPAPTAAPSSPTVNGTAERRNAGATTIGNDLATARAADGKFVPRGSTAAQRIRERTRRLSGG